MIPVSVLMAVSVYDRASDWMYPRFFGIFRSSCLSAHQVEAEPALKAGCGCAPSRRTIRRKSIVLDLVQPFAAGRQFIGFGWEARRDKPGREGAHTQHNVPIARDYSRASQSF
jgi:hypothetical protein